MFKNLPKVLRENFSPLMVVLCGTRGVTRELGFEKKFLERGLLGGNIASFPNSLSCWKHHYHCPVCIDHTIMPLGDLKPTITTQIS